MSWRTALRQYALQEKPEKLPNSIRFSHSDTSLIIFDAYPKSIFHFLVLARPTTGLPIDALDDLRTLMKLDKQKAKRTLLGFKDVADELRQQIESEMINRYGYKWEIWAGFHAVPSMLHLHLHVISSDLNSSAMKNKKHYNSFHPRLGFFLHLDDVLEWFDATESYWTKVSQLNSEEYEPILKEPLQCWKCERVPKNVPALKDHLKEHFNSDSEKARKKQEHLEANKRKRDVHGDKLDLPASRRQRDE